MARRNSGSSGTFKGWQSLPVWARVGLTLVLIWAMLWLFSWVSSQLHWDSTSSKPQVSVTSVSNESGLSEISVPSASLSGGIPEWDGVSAVSVLDDNKPSFSDAQLASAMSGWEEYAELDRFGRCGVCRAVVGRDIMPADDEARESIARVKPSGWNNGKYEFVEGGYLYNRCHLIGWQLSAENANSRNLVTGTRYMNIEGMLPYENMVADYVRKTGNHVYYEVTPIFLAEDLVCRGVEMQARSLEDDGAGISFHVFAHNVQPGIAIDYRDGSNHVA